MNNAKEFEESWALMDSTIEDAEDFILAEGYCIEASVPIDGGEVGDMLEFVRIASEWRLAHTSGQAMTVRRPLRDVSRRRKAMALLSLPALFDAIQENNVKMLELVTRAIAVARGAMGR